MTSIPFSDLRSAAYCPRKCYYDRQREDRAPPPEVGRTRALAFRYESLLEADDGTLASEPIERTPESYRTRLTRTRERLESENRWRELRSPTASAALVAGREVHGIVHKLLTDPLEPSLISTGEPPKNGVWEPHSVHAVAAAKALSWEFESTVERAWVEYPAYGVVRPVEITTRRKAGYRRTLRTVQDLGDPPSRLSNDAKCEACEYAEECGVRTRSLRSMLGFG